MTIKKMRTILLLGLPSRPTPSVTREGIVLLTRQVTIKQRDEVQPLRVRYH